MSADALSRSYSTEASLGRMARPSSTPDLHQMPKPDLTVYHDGSCCRFEIGHSRTQAGSENICFVDVSKPYADPGPDISRQDAMGRFNVRLGRSLFSPFQSTLVRAIGRLT